MPNWKWIALAAALPIAALAQGVVKPTSKLASGTVNIYDEMHHHVVPQAQVIWDITNAAMDDDGNPSAKKMKPADWLKLKEGTAGLSASLYRIARAGKFIVRTSEQKLLDEDAPTGAKAVNVERNVDGNPDGLRQYAKTLARYVMRMSVAADNHDIKTIYTSASELDGQCEGCHQAYWFANGKR